MDPVSSHLEKLQAAERQLLVFAREINQLYQAERARATELELALDRLRESYLDMIKTLAFVVEANNQLWYDRMAGQHEGSRHGEHHPSRHLLPPIEKGRA
jgi:hypothetical protein